MPRTFISAVLLTAMSGGTAACHEEGATGSSANVAASTSANTDAGQTDLCGARKVSEFIGQKDLPALHQLVRQRVDHDRIRWIHPGEAVTQDFSPARLNVIVGQDNRITTVRCG